MQEAIGVATMAGIMALHMPTSRTISQNAVLAPVAQQGAFTLDGTAQLNKEQR